MRDAAYPLALPGTRSLRLAAIRQGMLAALFVALAFSVTASQLLLAALVALGVAELLGRLVGTSTGLLRGLWRETAWVRRLPVTLPFTALALLTVLSAVFSGDPGWSLWMARDTLRIATFYVVLAYTRDGAHALRLWQGFLATLTVMAGYGLLQVYVCPGRPGLLGPGWAEAICTHPSRASGPFSIYMTFGGVLLLGAIFCLASLAHIACRRVWWMLPAGVLMLAALALTYSRNAWLGLAAGTVALAATARRGSRLLLLLVVPLLAAIALASPGTVFQRARSMLDLGDETVRDRLAMWRAGLAMIADHPVLGVGPGEVRAWYPHYRRPEAVRPTTGHLHSSPIHLAAERGLPALGVWLWLWTAFFRQSVRILGRLGRDRPGDRALGTASLAGVGAFLVAGLFEHNFGDAEVVMLVYALMALPFVVARDLPGPHGAPSPEPGGHGAR